jgi:hypothetical protein
MGIGVFPQIAWSLLTHNCITSTKIFFGVENAVEGLLQAGLTHVRFSMSYYLPNIYYSRIHSMILCAQHSILCFINGIVIYTPSINKQQNARMTRPAP